MTNLTELHQINQRWRAWMDANTPFKTPSTLDSLRYMDGETREVRDLWMREQLNHARNNGRQSSIYQELADVAMMALTALPDGGFERTQFMPSDIDFLCSWADSAVIDYRQDNDGWDRFVEGIIAFVDEYPGMDLPAELANCHYRLAWKHGSRAYAEQYADLGCDPWLAEAQP